MAALVAYALGVIVHIGEAVPMVFIPLYAHHLGISVGVIGLITAVPSLQEAIFRLPGGWLTDRWGETRVLTLAMWASVMAAVLYQAGPTLWWLGLGQIAYGFATLGFWSAGPSYVTKLGGPHVEGRVGLFAGAVGVGAIIGPLLSGQVFAWGGYPRVFLFFLAVALFSLVVVRMLPPATPVGAHLPGESSVFLLRYRAVQLGAIACFVAAIPTALAGSLLPVYLVEMGHSPLFPATLSSLRAGTMAAMAASSGLWMRRVPHYPLAVGLMLLAVGALSMVPLFPASPLLLGIASGVMGASAGALWVLSATMVRQGIPLRNLALGLAYTNIFWPVSVVLVRVGSGWLSQLYSSTQAFWAVAALASAVTGLAAWLVGRPSPP